MITQLTGLLVQKNPPAIVLDVQGVGYELDVPMSTFYALPDLGTRLTLVTHFVVREDAQLLYGFLSQKERGAFRQLIKISGVGPRIALAVLSGLSVDELAQAVTLQEADRLTRVPGIGKKTAERLVLELKGKLAEALPGVGGSAGSPAVTTEVLHALLALGYSEKEASLAVKTLPSDISVSDGIRHALKSLAR
jgi:Holliday junction DNA helicase RuvA